MNETGSMSRPRIMLLAVLALAVLLAQLLGIPWLSRGRQDPIQ